jgi:hypothetical protein
VITIEVDPRKQAAIQAALNAEPIMAVRALVRTVNKVLNSVRSQGLRAIARAHDMPLASLRRRRRAAVVKASRTDLSGLAWFGTVPVKAGYLGKPRQSRLGARVGQHRFDGAFVATLPSGHIGIFRRRGQSRLPIVEQTVQLSAARTALAPIEAGLGDQVEKVFQQEMNYERLRGK